MEAAPRRAVPPPSPSVMQMSPRGVRPAAEQAVAGIFMKPSFPDFSLF